MDLAEIFRRVAASASRPSRSRISASASCVFAMDGAQDAAKDSWSRAAATSRSDIQICQPSRRAPRCSASPPSARAARRVRASWKIVPVSSSATRQRDVLRAQRRGDHERGAPRRVEQGRRRLTGPARRMGRSVIFGTIESHERCTAARPSRSASPLAVAVEA